MGRADVQKIERFAEELFRIGGVKLGEFTLKSGIQSPIYVDLRVLVSHPEVLRMAGEALVEVLAPLQPDRIAGLPYAGLPLAVSASLAGDLPMLYARKEAKDYGTRKLIEGQYEPGMTVALVDDVITDGGAKLELAVPFLQAGLLVKDVVVLVDREQGGAAVLAEHGYRLHAVFKLRELVSVLGRAGTIAPEQHDQVLSYLERARG